MGHKFSLEIDYLFFAREAPLLWCVAMRCDALGTDAARQFLLENNRDFFLENDRSF
jgi:hypothetical protein